MLLSHSITDPGGSHSSNSHRRQNSETACLHVSAQAQPGNLLTWALPTQALAPIRFPFHGLQSSLASFAQDSSQERVCPHGNEWELVLPSASQLRHPGLHLDSCRLAALEPNIHSCRSTAWLGGRSLSSLHSQPDKTLFGLAQRGQVSGPPLVACR